MCALRQSGDYWKCVNWTIQTECSFVETFICYSNFNTCRTEEESPSSDEKMDTGSDTFQSQDTPNSNSDSDDLENTRNPQVKRSSQLSIAMVLDCLKIFQVNILIIMRISRKFFILCRILKEPFWPNWRLLVWIGWSFSWMRALKSDTLINHSYILISFIY